MPSSQKNRNTRYEYSYGRHRSKFQDSSTNNKQQMPQTMFTSSSTRRQRARVVVHEGDKNTINTTIYSCLSAAAVTAGALAFIRYNRCSRATAAVYSSISRMVRVSMNCCEDHCPSHVRWAACCCSYQGGHAEQPGIPQTYKPWQQSATEQKITRTTVSLPARQLSTASSLGRILLAVPMAHSRTTPGATKQRNKEAKLRAHFQAIILTKARFLLRLNIVQLVNATVRVHGHRVAATATL